MLFSSPEPSGSKHELIVYPCSGVCQLSSVHHFQRSSSLKPLGQSVKFYVKHHQEGGMKVNMNGQGHMTKLATMPISGENFKKLLQNQKGDDLETWHEALMTGALQSLFK